MAFTSAADLVVPEVWADAMQAEFEKKAVIAGLATVDNTLEGVPGDTVHFPKFNMIADEAQTLTEADVLVPVAMTSVESTAVVEEAGKAVEITDRAALDGAGDPLGEIRRQLGIMVARRIDTRLKDVAEAAGANVAGGATTAMSWNSLVDAMASFDDTWDPQEAAGIVVHSKQHAALMKDSLFISADSVGGNGALRNGQVGSIAGIPVFVSNRVTTGTGTAKALLIKRGALALLYKRRPIVEVDRNILARHTTIATNVHFAVKRMNDKGVCVLTTTAP